MDLAKTPEHIVLVLSSSLDFELFSELWINCSSIIDTIEHLSFGERTTCVDIKVVLNIFFRISSSSSVFKESKLANEVLIVQIDVGTDTIWLKVLVSLFIFGEESVLQLVCNIVCTSESSKSNWHFHPRLAEEWVIFCSGIMERINFVCSYRSNDCVSNDLRALHRVDFVDLLCI